MALLTRERRQLRSLQRESKDNLLIATHTPSSILEIVESDMVVAAAAAASEETRFTGRYWFHRKPNSPTMLFHNRELWMERKQTYHY